MNSPEWVMGLAAGIGAGVFLIGKLLEKGITYWNGKTNGWIDPSLCRKHGERLACLETTAENLDRRLEKIDKKLDTIHGAVTEKK